MRISDWSSDVCSSDLVDQGFVGDQQHAAFGQVADVADHALGHRVGDQDGVGGLAAACAAEFVDHFGSSSVGSSRPAKLRSALTAACQRSEEHTSELQSLMRNSYAVFCLTKKNTRTYM